MTSNPNQVKAKWAFFGGSIRHQLAWSFVGVALILVTGLAGLLFERQRDFLYRSAVEQANSLTTSLASSSASWVLANDIAGLNEVLQGFTGLPDLKRAYILSLHGEVLGSTRPDEAGLFVTDVQNQKLLNAPSTTQVLLANVHQIDVAVPVMAGFRHVGWARVEMTMDSVKANLHSIVVMGINFIALAVLTVVGVAILLARGLTRRLHHLMRVATEVTSGNLKVRAHLSGRDEVCVLAQGFNQMLDALSNSERQRERINALYAAWTESVNIIVRESDEVKLLGEVCLIIASHLAMKLVWVGMTEPEGWVRCVAASHPDSNYLRNIKVSSDQTLQEGQGPIGRAIREGAPIIVNSYLNESSLQPWHVIANAENINAMAAFPLMRNGRCIGAITVYSDEQDFFTPDLIGLMRGLTNDLSYALDNFDRAKQRIVAEHEQQIAAVAFDSQEGMLVTDAENHILRVNKSFIELTGYRADEVIGKSPNMLSSGLQGKEFYKTMWESILRDKYWQGEVWNKRKNGDVYPEWLCITAITNPQGVITNYVGTFTDISQRKADEDSIRALAYYDPLTKLPNRTLLFDRLNLALNVSYRNKTHGALMFVDLDNFKILNDTLGHDLGDQLLIEVGRRLQGCVRDVDTVARLGGDEFVVMLEFLNEQEFDAAIQANTIAEKVRSTLAELYRLEINTNSNFQSVIEHYSTASVGFVLFMGHETSSEELLKRADLAMYQAKHAGKNEIRAFIPEMQISLNLRTALEIDLRNALSRNELSLYYQVQVDVSGQPVGAEALIRWNQTEHGMIPPSDFIPLAEETGLILPVGKWILRQGCETLAEWANYPETCKLKLAINVSSRQFSQADFVEQIHTILVETGANPMLLKLEITESIILDNVEETIAKMHAIRDLGVNFSMDDFGTGYSSLSYLQRLPLQQLKIDQSFVKNMNFNKHDSTIVRTILALGANLDIEVIAEGVETKVQFEHLLNAGCLVFQGYLYGRPVPADIFKQTLLENRRPKIL